MRIEEAKLDTFADDLKGSEFFVPVRNCDDGHEFFLLDEIGSNYQHAEQLQKKSDEQTPQWAKANKAVRIQKIKLVAIAID